MRIDVCIPAYNEASIIAASVGSVRAALQSLPCETRIIVADNGSDDGTNEVVQNLGYANVEVLAVPIRGKGAAVVAAARYSDADFFGFIDADLSAEPSNFSTLYAALVAGADIAIGSRLHPDAAVERHVARTVSSRAFNILRGVFVSIPVYDTQCGIKLSGKKGKDILVKCIETGWFFEIEWLARAHMNGLVIRELPVEWKEFRFPERASKLRIVRDGFAALAAFTRIRNILRHGA